MDWVKMKSLSACAVKKSFGEDSISFHLTNRWPDALELGVSPMHHSSKPKKRNTVSFVLSKVK